MIFVRGWADLRRPGKEALHRDNDSPALQTGLASLKDAGASSSFHSDSARPDPWSFQVFSEI